MNRLLLKRKIATILTISVFSISGILLINPNKAEAVVVPVGDYVNFGFHASQQLKEHGLDAVAWAFAQEAKNALTANILDWVGGGFSRDPAFVQSPIRFIENLEKRTATEFFRQRNSFLSSSPFGDQVVSALIFEDSNNYNSRGYNLGEFSNNPEAFLSGDFSEGGWGAWFGALGNPNNTFLGSYKEAQEAKNVAVSKKEREELLKLQWGDGFKSIENEKGEVLTPGIIIKSQIEDVLGSGLRSLENADELSEIISAVVGSLTQDIFSSTGLVGASEAISGNSSLTDLLRQATAESILGGQDKQREADLIDNVLKSQVPLPEPEETPSSGSGLN